MKNMAFNPESTESGSAAARKASEDAKRERELAEERRRLGPTLRFQDRTNRELKEGEEEVALEDLKEEAQPEEGESEEQAA